MCGNGRLSPLNLHGAQHELLTERSCFESLWHTKLGRHVHSLSTLTCSLDVDSFLGGSFNHSENISDLLSSQSCSTNLKDPQGGVCLFCGSSASPSRPLRRSTFVSLSLPYKWSCGGVGRLNSVGSWSLWWNTKVYTSYSMCALYYVYGLLMVYRYQIYIRVYVWNWLSVTYNASWSTARAAYWEVVLYTYFYILCSYPLLKKQYNTQEYGTV